MLVDSLFALFNDIFVPSKTKGVRFLAVYRKFKLACCRRERQMFFYIYILIFQTIRAKHTDNNKEQSVD